MTSTPKDIPASQTTPIAQEYKDDLRNINYKQRGQIFEEAVIETIRLRFDDVHSGVRLDNDFATRADAVFRQKVDQKTVTWAVEARTFAHEIDRGRSEIASIASIRAWIRATWGGYQPLIEDGVVDKVLMVTELPLPDTLLRTMRRYSAMTHTTLEELDNFLKNLPSSVSERIRPVPPQGAGPHFTIDESGKIGLLAISDQDQEGNYPDRIRTLLPLVKQNAEFLRRALTNTDAFPEISEALKEYVQAISNEPASISWGLVYGLGVFLDNAATATAREIDDRLRPSLEDTSLAALNSLRVLHGNLILATSEGRELQEQADRLELSQREQKLLQSEAEKLSIELSRNDFIAQKNAARVVTNAAKSMGEGRYPERGSTFGIVTIKNVGTVLVSAAFIGSLLRAGIEWGGVPGGAAAGSVSWMAFEALKKTKSYASATQALGQSLDVMSDQSEQAFRQAVGLFAHYVDFIKNNEALLRRITSIVHSMSWITPYINQIVNLEEEEREENPSKEKNTKLDE